MSIIALSKFVKDFGDVGDTKILSVDDKNWTISAKDSKKIKQHTNITLNILAKIDKKTDIDTHITKLKDLVWIKDDKLFIKHLNDIFDKYLSKIDGFVMFTKKGDVNIFKSSQMKKEYALVRIALGNFAAGVRNKFNKHGYVAKQ